VAFDKVRQSLLRAAKQDVLDQPLAYLASAVDRNLPFALLGRTVNDILATSFETLYHTPSVGPKKMLGLVHLLERAVVTDHDTGAAAPAMPQEQEQGSSMGNSSQENRSEIAEEIWSQWRAKVVRFNLGDEPLGRFARSLRDLSRSTWHTPLGFYYRLPLSEIRALPAHGSKRIAAVMTVFEDLHHLLSNTKTLPHLSISILPRLVSQIEHWALEATPHRAFPNRAEVEAGLVRPLVGQIQIDADPRLVEWTVRALKSDRFAERSAGTRGSREFTRFYWEKIRDIVQIRWPRGRLHIQALLELADEEGPTEDRYFFEAVAQLFFGNSCRASAPLARHKNPSSPVRRCAHFVPRNGLSVATRDNPR